MTCVVLVVLSTAITAVHFFCLLHQCICTTSRIYQLNALNIAYHYSERLNKVVISPPKELDAPDYSPHLSTIVYGDGFKFTFPFELTKSSTYFCNYRTHSDLSITLMPSLVDKQEGFSFGESQYTFIASYMQLMPKSMRAMQSPRIMIMRFHHLIKLAMQLKLLYFKTDDNIIAYMEETDNNLLVIHAYNKDTLLCEGILINSDHTTDPLTEEEIAYILNHIEPAPRWEVEE